MTDWISRMIEGGGYFGVMLLMFVETLFPPIPSEVIMPMAGIAAARGSMSVAGVIAAGTAGAMAGNLFWYVLARALGVERFHPFILKWGRWVTMSWGDVRKADRWFDRRGWLVVLIGRMTPSLRSLISIPAGLFGMPLRTFLLASTIGTLGWTAMLALVGRSLGENYASIDDYLGPLSTGVIVVLLVIYAYRVLRWRPHD